MNISTSVLVVAYRRSNNLKTILERCAEGGIKSIYVSLDGPKEPQHANDVEDCKKVVEEFKEFYSGDLFTNYSLKNRGSAISVIKGCDWIFQNAEFAIILEDDCIPSLEFFQYTEDAKQFLMSKENIFSISGTQLAPLNITNSQWIFSKYPLFWGWATSREKWQQASQNLLHLNLIKYKKGFTSQSEFCFWKSGARRAIEGFVDAWDLPLLFSLESKNMIHIHPGENLIENIGVDFAATHTTKESQWIGRGCGSYKKDYREPSSDNKLDKWLLINFYKISKRHFFSTKLTYILDALGINKRVRPPLINRLIDN